MSAFTSEQRVDFGDCDPVGIVYFPNFYRWMDAAFHQLTRELGFDQASLASDYALLGTPLVDTRARFYAPVRPGDRLTIETRVTHIGGSSLALGYRIRLGEKLAAEGEETRVFVAERDGALKPAPIPDDIRQGLSRFTD